MSHPNPLPRDARPEDGDRAQPPAECPFRHLYCRTEEREVCGFEQAEACRLAGHDVLGFDREYPTRRACSPGR